MLIFFIKNVHECLTFMQMCSCTCTWRKTNRPQVSFVDLKRKGTKNNMIELRANISIIPITEDELKCYIQINNLRFDLKAKSSSKYYIRNFQITWLKIKENHNFISQNSSCKLSLLMIFSDNSHKLEATEFCHFSGSFCSVLHSLQKGKSSEDISSFNFFRPNSVACGILVSQPGVKLRSPALEAQSLKHWTVREGLWPYPSSCLSERLIT